MKTSGQGFVVLRRALIITLVFLMMAAWLGPNRAVQAKKPNMLIYFDGHMHSVRSDGSGTVDQIKSTALSRGLDVVIITDHCKDLSANEWATLVDETAAATDGSFLALPGFEMTGSEGLFNRDHMLAYGVGDPFVGDDALELCPEEVWPSPPNPAGTGVMYPENLAKWADYVHSRGGIVVHNHPSGTTRLDYGVNHLEVYNQSHVDDVTSYASALGYPPNQAWQLGLTLNNFTLYGERDTGMYVSFPGFPSPVPLRYGLWYATQYFIPPYIGQWLGEPEAPLSSWDELLMAFVEGVSNKPIFALANSDSHDTGSPDSTLGYAKNGLYVKEFTAEGFYEAVKAGRSFATTGPSLAFTVNGKQMGDTSKVSTGSASIDLSVNSESSSAYVVKIDIIKNGAVWKTVSPMSPAYQATLSDALVTADGYYRIEVTSLDPASGKYDFAWSNPVFIKVP